MENFNLFNMSTRDDDDGDDNDETNQENCPREQMRYARTLNCSFLFLRHIVDCIMWSHAVVWTERDVRKTSRFSDAKRMRRIKLMNGFNDNGTLISDVFGSDFRIRDGIISISIAKIGGKYSSVFQLEIS